MEAVLRCCILLLATCLAVSSSSREPRRQHYLHTGPESSTEALAAARSGHNSFLRQNASSVAKGGVVDVAHQEPPPSEKEQEEKKKKKKAEEILKKAILEGDEDAVQEMEDRARHSADEMINLPNAMDDMIESNQEQLDILLPGLKARTSSLVTLPAVVICGLAWLLVYFRYWYVLDHEEYLIRAHDSTVQHRKSVEFAKSPGSPREWLTRKLSLSTEGTSVEEDLEDEGELDWENVAHAQQLEHDEESTNKMHLHADMIFVFHHPSHPYSDRTAHVTCDMIKRCTAHRRDSGFFAEFERVIAEHEKKTREESMTEKGKKRLKNMVGTGEVLDINMQQARILVIKDMVRSLPLMGFNVAMFTSVDDDELFLCISLSRPEVIQHYLQRESKELQTTHDVVERLKIVQDPRDPASSPPFVRYDQRIIQALKRADVIDEAHENQLYRTYHDRDAEGSVMSSRERIRVIQRELTRYLNIGAAEECGLLKTWYPCHSELWLLKLRATWSSWERMKDFTFHQPIPLLREYFGSQLAFSFAWQGVWCKGLCCLMIAAIIITVLKFGPPMVLDYGIVPEKQIMPFAILVLLWARVVTNLWIREEEYFRCLWNQETIDDQIVRPSFKGKYMKSEVDENIMEETVPPGEKIGLRVISVMITLFCCGLVMLITGAWVHIHEGDLDLISSLCLTIMVKVFEFLYNMLSAKLVEMENHKFDQDYHDAWVWQQFLFQAVNNYWACISIAFSQKVSNKCPEIGCFESLQKQVSMLVVILLACSIGLILVERVQVWFLIWMEDYQLAHREDKTEETSRSFLEEQSKFGLYDMRAQIENTLQLVIGLGFVLLFGTLQPLVVPLCFVHFLCTMRCRAVLLTWFSRRVLPHKLNGVGAWSGVMSVLMNLSVFFSGVLIVCWGRFFHGSKLLAKITGLVVWIMMISSLWALVDIVCPAKSDEAQIMLKRRTYANRIIIEASMDSKVAEGAAPDEDLHSLSSQEEARGDDSARERPEEERRIGEAATEEAAADLEAAGGLDSPRSPDKQVRIQEDKSEKEEENAMPRSRSKSPSKARHAHQLVFTDALSHRALHLVLDCDVEELVPQGPVVQDELWENIPRLSGKLAKTAKTSRAPRP